MTVRKDKQKQLVIQCLYILARLILLLNISLKLLSMVAIAPLLKVLYCNIINSYNYM